MNHKKIAKLANVSPSTVSKALSGNKEINEETAERIRKIAIEYGYFKEKSKRKRENADNKEIFIAVLVPEVAGGHYSEVITSLQRAIEARGGNISVYIYDFNIQKKEELLNSIILRGSADGVILFSSLPKGFKTNIPVVCMTSDCKEKCDTIGVDVLKAVYDSVKYMKGLGHEKIGFVGEHYTLSKSDAFESAMKDCGLDYKEEFVYIVKDRFEKIGLTAAEQIAESKERPTAIIAAYDEIALSLVHGLVEKGIKVPEDISVMGINNISASAYAGIPLTTVEVFSEEQHKTAVDMLFDKILNETKSVKHIIVEHRIIERQSTKELK